MASEAAPRVKAAMTTNGMMAAALVFFAPAGRGDEEVAFALAFALALLASTFALNFSTASFSSAVALRCW